MTIKLRVIDFPENLFSDTQVGDMWRVPERDRDGRQAWLIRLPNDLIWCTTERASGDGIMWDVVGEPPNITVTPSIDAEGRWHGFITNGELVGV